MFPLWWPFLPELPFLVCAPFFNICLFCCVRLNAKNNLYSFPHLALLRTSLKVIIVSGSVFNWHLYFKAIYTWITRTPACIYCEGEYSLSLRMYSLITFPIQGILSEEKIRNMISQHWTCLISMGFKVWLQFFEELSACDLSWIMFLSSFSYTSPINCDSLK